MCLEVCLCHDVQAVLVAEFIPHGVVGIVARAHGIDIELFHQADILNHPFAGNDITSVGVHLMPVGALDEHWLTVHEQLSALDFHLPKAYFLHDSLRLGTLLGIFPDRQQPCDECI